MVCAGTCLELLNMDEQDGQVSFADFQSYHLYEMNVMTAFYISPAALLVADVPQVSRCLGHCLLRLILVLDHQKTSY